MHSLRPCVNRACHRAIVRSISTASSEKPQLQDPQDWTAFQTTRASFKTLTDSLSQYGSTQTRGAAWKLRDDLDHTLPLLKRAANLVRAVAVGGGQVVFLGTRPDLRPVVQKAAERMGSQGYHVGDRWLPGTLTNKWKTFGHETVRAKKVMPDLVVILNPLANMSAIHECALSHIPTIGIVDSNVDPRIVMYPIPANDESTRTAEIIAGVLSIAGREGVSVVEMESMEREEEARRREVKKSESEELRYEDSRLDV
uniref:Ribosomal protein S2 n=1 Tax=Moniliophthora roreri TaxID=221103 RepID=A0A0W0FU89_MONRR